MKKRIKVLALIGIAAVLIASLAVGAREEAGKEKAASKDKDDLYASLEIFADAVSLIRSDYADEVDSKKLIYGALKGMLISLDDFSQFLEPDDYAEIRLETKGEFGGVGIEISMRDGVLTVIAALAGTPADAAGVKAGDRIVKINGVITREMSVSEAVKMMRGAAGTSVTLTVWREKEEKVLEIPIRRAVIKIRSVKEARLLEDGIGYVHLVEFQENSPRDMEEALAMLEAKGMGALILDLRNNPGGLLDVAVALAERFLPKDAPVVSIKGRSPGQDAVFVSSGKFVHPDYPLVVLVNEGSASASEIVAGAIQDNKRGIILGTKTFGKGSVQTVIPLRDGSALRLTTASYLTPSGRMIRDKGIIPDVVVERKDAGSDGKGIDVASGIFEKLEGFGRGPDANAPPAEIKRGNDNQLERSLDLIKALKVYRTVKVDEKK